MGNFNVILSTITVGALVGLVILNFQGSQAVFGTLGKDAVDYVKAVQGR